MLFQFRGVGAFLLGMCLTGGVAHAQFGVDCTFQPDCAVAMPTCAVAQPSCAVGEISCDTYCAPVMPPVRYEVPQYSPMPMPSAPITYEVIGGGCAPMSCAPDNCVSIPCEGLPYASTGCVEIGCDNSACLGGSCRTGGNSCLGASIAGAAIDLVDGTKEKYRNLSRNWYYKSFDRHRHLNHPIISPAHHPAHGYYQTCWERFPEEALWCPPCYGTASSAADLYNAPVAYPTTTAPITPPAPSLAPPTAPPASPMLTPPANPPATTPELPPAASAVSPTASAAMLYAP